MSMLGNAKMAANMAFSPILAGARQAKSYAKPMAKLGWGLSKQVINHATSNGLLMKAGIGAGIGAAAGAGYGATEDRATAGSIIRAGIGGAVLGAGVGAGYGVGRSAYAMRGSENALNLMANGRLLGRDMRGAGSAIGAGFAGAGRTMRPGLLHAYGRASGAVMRGVNSARPGVESAYGRARGAATSAYSRMRTPSAQINLF